jgi:hypothetical protein
VSHSWWVPALGCLLSYWDLADIGSSQGGMSELLASSLEEPTYRSRLCVRELFYMASAFTLSYSCIPFSFCKYWGTEVTMHRALYGCCMVPERDHLTTLLSPRQCRAALCTIYNTLASVDQSLIHCLKTLPSCAVWTPRAGFCRGKFI